MNRTFAFCALLVLLCSCGAFALSSDDVRDVLAEDPRALTAFAERVASLLRSEPT